MLKKGIIIIKKKSDHFSTLKNDLRVEVCICVCMCEAFIYTYIDEQYHH